MNIEKEVEKYNKKRDSLTKSLLVKLSSYMTGRKEAARQYGVAINDLEVKQKEALAEGAKAYQVYKSIEGK